MNKCDLFFRIRKRMTYFLCARHGKGFGVHSPFFYDFVMRVMRNKKVSSIVLDIENIRKRNLHDGRIIDIVDLGAGSVKMKNNTKRKISDIAKYSTVPGKYGLLLYNLSSAFGNKSIIELGTSLGMSTMYMAAGNPEAVVYSIEGCESTAAVAKENIQLAGVDNIRQLTGNFDDVLPELCRSGICPGLVFIDGNHTKEPTLDYFNMIADISDNDTVIAIDDIDCSTGMEEAWKTIAADDRVTSTADLGRMGIVFFKKGLSKMNLLIRY